MEKARRHITEGIITLALEIIYLLTGEDCTVVMKKSKEVLNPRDRPLPQSLIQERRNDQKVLHLTNKMIELLTGEEEWEYLNRNTDLYKDVMVEDHQPKISPVESSRRRRSEKRCPSPLYSRACAKECVSQELQSLLVEDEDLFDFKVEVIEDEEEEDRPLKEEEVSTEISTETGREEKDIIPGSPEEYRIASVMSHLYQFRTDLSSDLSKHEESFSDQPYVDFCDSEQSGRELYFCSECEKCFITKSKLLTHRRTHRNEKKFLCSQCGIYFSQKTTLVQHQKLHTDGKLSSMVQHPLSHMAETLFHCSDCGEGFADRLALLNHQKNHMRLKSFSCSECGKYFALKSGLARHQRIHTGEKPFPCSECWKFFAVKSDLVKHQRIHTGEKPFLCSECGKRFTQKTHFTKHQRTHTGEKPYSCSDCGKCFSQKPHLVKHKRIHTGEKPFKCSECGRGFTGKQILLKHQRIHTSHLPSFSGSDTIQLSRTKSSMKPKLCNTSGAS
ncbi:uncharacterized protein LOC143765045 [Ranitomeya variabilis]|uniref:uncharacterized protein LOC143765045 n=1 Tax=Ranitomeya variabilis TaxID=490064 RepID=UPI004056F729